jgi:hypothetical protein
MKTRVPLGCRCSILMRRFLSNRARVPGGVHTRLKVPLLPPECGCRRVAVTPFDALPFSGGAAALPGRLRLSKRLANTWNHRPTEKSSLKGIDRSGVGSVVPEIPRMYAPDDSRRSERAVRMKCSAIFI